MSKYVALPYIADQNEPSVPLRDLVDTPDDFREEAFKNTFNMMFEGHTPVLKDGDKEDIFGDYAVCDSTEVLWVYFTKVM